MGVVTEQSGRDLKFSHALRANCSQPHHTKIPGSAPGWVKRSCITADGIPYSHSRYNWSDTRQSDDGQRPQTTN